MASSSEDTKEEHEDLSASEDTEIEEDDIKQEIKSETEEDEEEPPPPRKSSSKSSKKSTEEVKKEIKAETDDDADDEEVKPPSQPPSRKSSVKSKKSTVSESPSRKKSSKSQSVAAESTGSRGSKKKSSLKKSSVEEGPVEEMRGSKSSEKKSSEMRSSEKKSSEMKESEQIGDENSEDNVADSENVENAENVKADDVVETGSQDKGAEVEGDGEGSVRSDPGSGIICDDESGKCSKHEQEDESDTVNTSAVRKLFHIVKLLSSPALPNPFILIIELIYMTYVKYFKNSEDDEADSVDKKSTKSGKDSLQTHDSASKLDRWSEDEVSTIESFQCGSEERTQSDTDSLPTWSDREEGDGRGRRLNRIDSGSSSYSTQTQPPSRRGDRKESKFHFVTDSSEISLRNLSKNSRSSKNRLKNLSTCMDKCNLASGDKIKNKVTFIEPAGESGEHFFVEEEES